MKFKYGYYGTSIDDFLNIFEFNETDLVVFDNSKTYGTTIHLKELIKEYSGNNSEINSNQKQEINDKMNKKTKIKNLKIQKMDNEDCFIETDPHLFLHTDERIDKIEELDSFQSISFIEVKNHFLITENDIFRIPYTLFQIAELNWMNMREKQLFYSFVSHEIPFEEFQKNVSEKCLKILKSIILKENSKNNLPIYLKIFGNVPFYYPLYGEKEISDQFSRILAFRNVAFYLDQDLKVTNSNQKYELKGKYGNITFTNLIKKIEKKLPEKHIKVLLLNEKYLENKFYATFQNNENIIYIFSLDSTTRICPKNTFLIYIYSFHSLPDDILKTLRIDKKSILNEFDFITSKKYLKKWSNLKKNIFLSKFAKRSDS